MGKQERHAYLEAIRTRYRRANKTGKSVILDESCAVRGYHRKYALRLLGTQHNCRRKVVSKAGPVSRYDIPELVEALRSIWMASDQLCSKRLKAALPIWLPHYQTSFHPLTADTLTLLDSISAIACSSRSALRRVAKACRAPSLGRYSRSTSPFKPGYGM